MSPTQPVVDAPPSGDTWAHHGPERHPSAPAHRAGPPRRPIALWRFWPALLLWVYALAALRVTTGLGLDVTGVFSAYMLGMIVIPGTLLWRALRLTGRAARDLERRPLAEDIALGTVLGYVCELPVYLLARHLDHPMAVMVWPAVVVVASLVTRASRRVWTRDPNGSVVPTWWATAMTAILLLALVTVARFYWAAAPGSSITTLEHPYVDDPYHLALIADLRHHFPAQVPYVAGTPLYYHWLTYAHVASSSWVTGIEPAVLFKTLTLPTVGIAAMVAGAMVAVRLSGRWWPGLIPAVGLSFMSPPGLFRSWLVVPMSTPFIQGFGSPTQTFATLMATLTLLVFVELLRGTLRTPRWWALAAVLYLALAGSKSAFPPIMIAGLAFTAVLALLGRRLDRPAWGLLVLSGLGFIVAQRVFYGTGSRSLVYSPLHAVVRMAQGEPGLHTGDGHVPTGVRLILALWLTSVVAVWVSGLVGYLTRGGWRDTTARFLLGVALAGWSLMMLLGHPNLSEYYLLQSALLPALLLSALGLGRLDAAPRSSTLSRVTVGRVSAVVLVLATLAGRWLAPALTGHRSSSDDGRSPVAEALQVVLAPTLVFWGVVAVVLLLMLVILQRVRAPRESCFLLAGVLLMGLAITPPMKAFAIGAKVVPPTSGHVVLPTGGIAGARFLRDHTTPDDLVATNGHCTSGPRKGCTHRSFWVSAYTERRVLVEGWAYIPLDTVGDKADSLVTDRPTFWDPDKLAANDRVFAHPTVANLRVLRTKYHVRWLLVDLRYPRINTTALAANARLRFMQGQTAVYELR